MLQPAPANQPRRYSGFRTPSLTHRSSGQGLVEYALIIMLVAMVVFAALALIGPSLANFFSSVPNQL
jgi:pilus assembly protein Flp/PilA